MIEKLRQEGVEMKAIHQRLQEDHEFRGSCSALLRYVRHLEPIEPEAFVRIEVAPGAEAQVYFGSTGEIVDPETGEVRRA